MSHAATNGLKILFCIVGIFSLPASAYAAVAITEIMYDAPGSDQGHEWVEVTNVGTTPLNLAGYKFFEGGVNHALVLAAGTSTLPAGASAIISNDPQQFAASWPRYSGAIFKSSFSLLNTGETIAIKNASSTIVAAATYASAMGAQGDGNSLHLVGSLCVAAKPDPGLNVPVAPAAAAGAGVDAAASITKSNLPKTKTFSLGTSSPLQQSTKNANAPAGPLLTAVSPFITSVIMFAAFLVLGAGALLYKRFLTIAAASPETGPSANEFEIE